MLRLILFRHAKSSWDDHSAVDYDRPLAARGLSAAPVMAAAMLELGLAPQVIVCSPARRTRQTLEAVLGHPGCAGWSRAVRFDERLYLASPKDILAAVASLPPGTREVMVVGHNPGLQDLAVQLSAAGDPDTVRAMRIKVPTAAVIVIELPIVDASECTAAIAGRLQSFITPAMRGFAPRFPGYPGP